MRPGSQSPPRSSSSGYTLIELLVVVGLIAVLTAALGLGLRGASEARAMAATDGLVRAQLEAARVQATLRGHATALALFGESGDDERYLRELVVVEFDPTAGWQAIADGVTLAGEVQFEAVGDTDTLWRGPVTVNWDAANPAVSCYLIEYSQYGTLITRSGGVVRWGQVGGESSGLTISRYGVVSAWSAATEGAGSP